MKKLLTIVSILLSSFSAHATIHVIHVWDGYFQFLPSSLTIQLGDTIQWLPLDVPSHVHTITSANIPAGADAFDQIWQAPADTFFQCVPLVAGLYEYVCTPHATSFNMVGNFTVMDETSAVGDLRKNIEPLFVYPNPAINRIRLSETNSLHPFRIYSIQGELLLVGITTNGEADISTLSSGLYFIEIIGDKKGAAKFIKK